MSSYIRQFTEELATEWGVPTKTLRKTLWLKHDHEFQKAYIAQYREQHPEETKTQRLKDWQTFKERNPERWRAINNAAVKRYFQKQKLRKAAEQQALQEAEKEGTHE